MISVSAIEKVLESEDIEGLLKLGAPRDEYAYEARTIQSELSDVRVQDLTESAVTAAVQKVWTESFGPFSETEIRKRMPGFRHVARQIMTQAQTLSQV
ncbi:MAG: DUF3156 family protein [Acidobacteriaceae bacterium]|nr:DUF3156 family protein [Acidobacteriaceae bacterium]MBV9779331.1 DUF3156 family protein [Acidobacteriaceae bacterium]